MSTTTAAHWRLEGKTALVTGGTRGIGRAVADELSSLGAAVLVVARDRNAVEAFVAERGQGAERVGVAADLSTAEGRRTLVDAVAAKWPQLDVLVNNVGTNIRKPTLDYSESEYHPHWWTLPQEKRVPRPIDSPPTWIGGGSGAQI